jgi:hypothetical protein
MHWESCWTTVCRCSGLRIPAITAENLGSMTHWTLSFSHRWKYHHYHNPETPTLYVWELQLSDTLFDMTQYWHFELIGHRKQVRDQDYTGNKKIQTKFQL